MKKTLKKLFAGISAVSVLMSVFFNTVTASSINDYMSLDDKGMLSDYGDSLNRDYLVYYQTNNLTSESSLYKMIPNYYYFRFFLNENVNYEDADERIMEIVKKYYPNIDDENQSDDDYCYIVTNTSNGSYYYTVYFSKDITSTSDDEWVIDAKEKSNAIMQKLNNENLISAFYDIGDIYKVIELKYDNYFTYNHTIDTDAVENFINENNLNCTMLTDINSQNSNYYSLVPSNEMEFDEYFSVATDLYEEFNISPSWSLEEDLDIEMNAVNSLENLSSESTITFKDYTLLNDNGIFNDNNSNYNMCYRTYESTGKTVLYKMTPVFNQIDFVLCDDVNFDEVNDSIIEIIDEYCPNNNYGSDAQSGEIYTSIKADTTVTPTKYTVTFYYENTSETVVKELQEKSDAIMNKLNDKKLISEFYGIGNNYSLLEYVFFDYFSYTTDSVDETMLNNIENYIEENNLNCTITQRTIDTGQFSEEILLSDEFDVYSLIPADDISFDEYFSVVADIYEEFDVKPFTCTTTDIPSIINGKNALDDLQVSTTPAETTPTETTTTTVSTTVTTELTSEPTETTTVTTTQPTTTSLSELTTTTTTVTTITTPQLTEQPKTLGDADGDNELTVRDCSFIALTIAQGRNDELSDSADFNADGEVNVRDAAAIAKDLAVK